MITRVFNNVSMKLQTVCGWPAMDVLICQEWDHPQTGKHAFYIEVSADEAELLIVEMQAAIAEARRIDAEYTAHMESEKDRVDTPDGMAHLF